MKEITYHKEGDYLIPDLIMDNSCENCNMEKYGRLRLNYIKNYKRGLYTELMINGTLSKHLSDIENAATSQINLIVKKLAESENINEQLKEHHQMEWIQTMNSFKNRAEEIVLNEMIYV